MLEYRKATLADVEMLIQLRKAQLIDEGMAPDTNVDCEMREYFTEHLKDESLVEWVVEDDAKIVATGGVQFYYFPPSYRNVSGIRGYVCNMYTSPEYRRKGLANALLDRVVQEAKQREVTQVFLSASDQGKPVYLKYGFVEKKGWMEFDGN